MLVAAVPGLAAPTLPNFRAPGGRNPEARGPTRRAWTAPPLLLKLVPEAVAEAVALLRAPQGQGCGLPAGPAASGLASVLNVFACLLSRSAHCAHGSAAQQRA